MTSLSFELQKIVLISKHFPVPLYSQRLYGPIFTYITEELSDRMIDLEEYITRMTMLVGSSNEYSTPHHREIFNYDGNKSGISCVLLGMVRTIIF